MDIPSNDDGELEYNEYVAQPQPQGVIETSLSIGM